MSDPPSSYQRIYVIEDDDDHYDVLIGLLKRTRYSTCAVTRFSELDAFRDHIREHPEPAIVLCDQNLPDSPAAHTSRVIMQSLPPQHVLIALTALEDADSAREILLQGAQDYLVKRDWTPHILGRAITNAIDRKSLMDEVQAANKELDGFTRMVSHDLKSPLAVISLECRAIREAAKSDPESVIEHAQSIEEETRNALSIIESMLAYARASWSVADTETVLPEEAVASAKKQIQTLVDDRPFSLSVGPLPPAEATETALRQIFQNLILNALKYNSCDEARVRIEASKDPPAGMARILVTDNGVGIDKRHHERVFAMGVRLNTEKSGTGRGLAISRRLARLLDGDLSIGSSSRDGTTFILDLPAARATE